MTIGGKLTETWFQRQLEQLYRRNRRDAMVYLVHALPKNIESTFCCWGLDWPCGRPRGWQLPETRLVVIYALSACGFKSKVNDYKHVICMDGAASVTWVVLYKNLNKGENGHFDLVFTPFFEALFCSMARFFLTTVWSLAIGGKFTHLLYIVAWAHLYITYILYLLGFGVLGSIYARLQVIYLRIL